MRHGSVFSPGSQPSTQPVLGTTPLLWHWRGNSRIILICLVHLAIDTSPCKQVENYFPRNGGDFLVAEVPWDSGGAGGADAQNVPRAAAWGRDRTHLVTSQAPKSAVIQLIPMCHKPFPFPTFLERHRPKHPWSCSSVGLAGFGWSLTVVKASGILPFQVFGFAATIVFAVDFYITFNDLVTFLKQGSSDSPEGRKTEGG